LLDLQLEYYLTAFQYFVYSYFLSPPSNFLKMVRSARFELTTKRLKVFCSTS
jgi:hypothetical protein